MLHSVSLLFAFVTAATIIFSAEAAVTGPPEPTVTGPPEPTVTGPPEAAVSAPPEAAVTGPPEPAVTAPPEPAVSAPPEPAVSAPPEPAVTGPPEPAVSAPPKPAVTGPHEPAVTGPPEPAVTAPPEPAVTAPPEPAVTGPPEPAVTAPPESAVTAPPESAVTNSAVTNSAATLNIRTTPVNPKTTVEAKKLYTALLQQYGKKILSGQQFEKTELDYVREHSGGKEPVIVGYDLMNILHFESRDKQQAYMQGVIDWSKKKGGVVTLCWHWRNPLGTANQWKTLGFYVKEKDGNDDVHVDLKQLSNKNSKEYKAIIRDIDHAAKYLKQLQTAKVPVLFRPLHEAYGKWFWWGEQGPALTKQLYRLLFDRLLRRHRLNNLLWVWTTSSDQQALDWYPGDERVDILGMDIYPELSGKDPHDIEEFPYKAVKELFTGKKMIALTENGAIPDPTKLVSHGDHWSWFCTWTGEKLTSETLNTKVSIKSTYNHEYVLTLGQFKV